MVYKEKKLERIPPMNNRIQNAVIVVFLFIYFSTASFAQSSESAPLRLPAKALETNPGIRSFHAETGKLRFLRPEPGFAIAQSKKLSSSLSPETAARSFLSAYGDLFGLRNRAQDLRVMKARTADRGRSFVRFQQMYQGIPILGGELITQMDANNNILSVNGEILPDIHLSTVPIIRDKAAVQSALATVRDMYAVNPTDFTATTPELWIYNPALLGAPQPKKNLLVWRIEVASSQHVIDEVVLLDAQTGEIALHFSQIPSARNRMVYDDQNGGAITLRRSEGDPPSGDEHVDKAYEYTGDAYDFYAIKHGRDSIDDQGMVLLSRVHYGNNIENAYWTGIEFLFGDAYGYPLADDVVAHEYTHAVTDFESRLIYAYQSGAIDEAFSDIWGEFIDLTNGSGTDTSEMRWLIGEDIAGLGAIRNMAAPQNFNMPDRMTSSYYQCGSSDYGGVHSNNSVAGKATYLMVDGGTFNGYTVTGLGISKVADLLYEVQTNLLTSAADYPDLYDAVLLACTNLGYDLGDCQEVKDALDATEMNLYPTQCQSGPEIKVKHGITSIPDATGIYEFDIPGVGSMISIPFAIQNVGNSPLELTGTPKIQLSTGTHEFATSQPSVSTIQPGEEASFTVDLMPSHDDYQATRITIPNNDSDENPYTFTLQGLPDKPEPTFARTIGTRTSSSIRGIQQTYDGGYLYGARTFDGVDIVKVDYEGYEEWRNSFDLTDSPFEVFSLEQIDDGGYLAVISTSGESSYVLRYDHQGTLIWQKQYTGLGYGLQQTHDGGYIAIGTWYTGLTKFDATGNVQWAKKYAYKKDVISEPVWGSINSVQETDDNGYLALGYIFQDFWILKLNSSGDLESYTIYDVDGTTEMPCPLLRTHDTGYMVPFRVASDANSIFLAKLYPDGSLQWMNRYSHPDISPYYGNGNGCYGIRQLYNGNYTVAYSAGASEFSNNQGTVLLTLSENGDILSQKAYDNMLIGSTSWFDNPIESTYNDDLLVLGYYDNATSPTGFFKLDGNGELSGCSLNPVELPMLNMEAFSFAKAYNAGGIFEYVSQGLIDSTLSKTSTLQQSDYICGIDMTVAYNGIELPSPTGSHNFGQTLIGQGKFDSFTIRNAGEVTLSLTGSPRVKLSGADAGYFSVLLEPSAKVPAGHSASFSILFFPDAERTYTAMISIANNDIGANPYTFTVTGTGVTQIDNSYLLWTK